VNIRLAATAALGAVLLAGCSAPSQNDTACKLFESSYNGLAGTVRAKLGTDIARSAARDLVTATRDAYDRAHGDVAVALHDEIPYTPGLTNGNSDQGTAFFMQAQTVAEKCQKDGAPITLQDMS
jgi:hypothetical protein